jgi:hypothetical protein
VPGTYIVIRYRRTISLKGVAMSALRTHPSGPATRRSARHDVRRASAMPHDVRREPVGGFAGRVRPDATVGTYGNVRHLRRQGAGTFAGDADRQRQGSFADSDLPVC